LLCYYILVFT